MPRQPRPQPVQKESAVRPTPAGSQLSAWERLERYSGLLGTSDGWLWRHEVCGESERLPDAWSARSQRSALMLHQLRDCPVLSEA